MRLPLLVLLSSTLLAATDLSTYRGFQIGMSLSAAVKHSGMDPSEVTTVHQRPARIEELVWNPGRFAGASADADPVQQVVFSFYNGQLSRMTVDYDNDKTEGMKSQDIVSAMSSQYGAAARPAAETLLSSDSFSDGVKVMARWENADISANLVQAPYGRRFGLIVFSRRLDGLAQSAIAEGIRSEKQDAPQALKADEQSAQAKLDKTRLVNRQNFRP